MYIEIFEELDSIENIESLSDIIEISNLTETIAFSNYNEEIIIKKQTQIYIIKWGIIMTTIDEKLNDIVTKYSIDYKDELVKEAIEHARQEILKTAFERIEKKVSTDANNNIFIDNYVSDSTFSYTVEKTDISLTHYATSSDTFITEDLNNNITSVVFDYPTGQTIIKMDGAYPQNGYELRLIYYKIADKYQNLMADIKMLETNYIYLYLLELLDKYKLQRGITNPGINSISLEYNKSVITEFKQELINKITTLISKIRPMYIRKININKEY